MTKSQASLSTESQALLMKKVTAAITLALLLLFASPYSVLAASVMCGTDRINTAIGCIPFSTESGLFTFILGWAVGIAGGLAFILIIVAGFMYITSGGDPKKAQAARELMTAAISGLLLLLFSGFLLRIIGVEILKLPGF